MQCCHASHLNISFLLRKQTKKKNEEFVILEGAAILTCYISFLQEKEQKIVVSLIQQKKEKKDCFATIV